MNEKLHYPKVLEERLVKVPFFAKANLQTYDDTYLYYHNQKCPSCRHKMIVINNMIRNFASVGVAESSNEKYVYPYVLCEGCSNIMMRFQDTQNVESVLKMEDRIQQTIERKLPYLAK